MTLTLTNGEMNLDLKGLNMSDGIVEEYTMHDVGSDEHSAITTPKFTVTLPDKDDTAAMDQFITSLNDKQAVHGVKSLTKYVSKHLLHTQISDAMWQRAVTSANNINGVRNSVQVKGDKKRSLRRTAEVFYGSLSTPVLRTQCTVFGLNFDSYESIDDVVTALVDKSVEVVVV